MPQQIIETEETLIIETPERVPLAFAIASIGNRFLAVTIDHFIQFLSIILVAWFFFLIFASYFIFFEWLWDGQTPGKRLMKLRVIRDDGRPITLWEAIARNLLRV